VTAVYPPEPFKPAVTLQPAVFDLAPPADPVCGVPAGPWDSTAYLHMCGLRPHHTDPHRCLVTACTRRWI
jgi:hypothetical protein